MTDDIRVPCPQCQTVLRLRDRKLLGRKGKCPNCSHRFLLEEPHQKKESSAKQQEAAPSRPDWMGSDSDSTTKLAPPPAKSKTTAPKPVQERSTPERAVTKKTTPIPESDFIPLPDGQPQDEFAGIGSLETPSASSAGVGRMQQFKTKQKKQRKIAIIAGGIIAVLVGVVSFWVMQKPDEPFKTPKVNKEWKEHKEELTEQAEVAKATSPTQGKPITLAYMPAGCRLLINVHPALFWEENSKGQEFRYCFGENMNNWLSATLNEFCKYQPQEIDEVLIGGILEGENSAPQFAAVVHLKKKQSEQEMVTVFEAERSPDYKQYPVYIKGDRAFLIVDEFTFVSSPAKLINESINVLADPSITNPAPTSIEELLKQTDRERHLTIMMEASDALIHKKTLLPESVHPLWDEFLLWLGKDVETFAWSIHLGEEEFDSEILLRNQLVRKPAVLHKDFQAKIDHLPNMVLGAVEKMNPQLAGPRKVIGRFPAMLKAFSMVTKGGTGKRHLLLTTRLPERAAPNLAIGTVLAWDESTRTNFSTKPTSGTPTTTVVKLPTTVIGRLRMKIDVDFRQTPLQDAFAYIGEETKTEVVVDGDGLKLSGFTKNMAQAFAMEQAPATHAIAKILAQRGYELMRVVVDEKNKKVIVTTKAVVDDEKLTAFDFAAEVKKK